MRRVIGCVVVLAITLCMLLSMTIPAAATEDEVRSVADGVLYFGIEYDGKFTGHGSCFLINEDTIITANHCVHSTKQEADFYGVSQKVLDKKMTFTVTIARDFSIPAKLLNASENMDFAILKLSQPLKNRTFLKLRDSKTVKAAEVAYSVGFPGSKDSVADTAKYYNTNDIIIESGTVNRAQYTEDVRVRSSIYSPFTFHFVGDVIQLTAGTASQGNSGGPMVDQNGNVIGVVSFGKTSTDGSSYASAISQVTEVLDSIGISYTPAPSPGPNPTPESTPVTLETLQSSIDSAKSYNSSDYTSESYAALQEAITAAEKVVADKDEAAVEEANTNLQSAISGLKLVQQNKDEKSDPEPKTGTNWVLVGVIIGVVALVIIVVVVLVVVMGKKKNDDVPPAAPTGFTPAQQPAFPQNNYNPPHVPAQTSGTSVVVTPDMGETTVLSGDAGETTVLSGDAGETTVLSQQVNGGTLVRLSNNESIPINYSGFTIGKKRREVDYCIGDNTNISRTHAKFIVRDGVTYIVDNKSTNGTFVNNSTVRPGDEVALNDGDTIMLADEKFEFKK